MKCNIVRDLLPSYIEGLTEKETSEEIKAHLNECEECRKLYNIMSQGEEIKEAESKEIDYLKKLHIRNIKKIVLAVIFSILVFALVLTGGAFAYMNNQGYFEEIDASAEDLIIKTNISDYADNKPENKNMFLSIELQSSKSRYVISDVETVNKDGVVTISVKRTRARIGNQGRDVWEPSVVLKGVKQVKIFDYVLWQDGHLIDIKTNEIFSSKIPYVGDASSFVKLMGNIDFGSPFTVELQTEKEPYGAVLHFKNTLNKKMREEAEKKAVLALALVDNLGEIYLDDESGYSYSLTLKQADSKIPELTKEYNEINSADLKQKSSIKDYCENVYDFYLLKEMTGI